MSTHLWHCNSALTGASRYFYNRTLEYTGFGHVFLSLLQNFLGNVISLSNLYISIEENLANNDTYAMHYDYARLTRILLVFDPVELVNEDLTYNPAYNDPDLIPDPDNNMEVPNALYSIGGLKDGRDWGPLARIVDSFDPSKRQSLPRTSQLNLDAPQALFTFLQDKEKGEWSDFGGFYDVI